jgi:hypothetical protein
MPQAHALVLGLQVRTLEGGHKTLNGVYVITDGGYHSWRVTQSPIGHKFSSHANDVRWNKWLESLQKGR